MQSPPQGKGSIKAQPGLHCRASALLVLPPRGVCRRHPGTPGGVCWKDQVEGGRSHVPPPGGISRGRRGVAL